MVARALFLLLFVSKALGKRKSPVETVLPLLVLLVTSASFSQCAVIRACFIGSNASRPHRRDQQQNVGYETGWNGGAKGGFVGVAEGR